MKKKDETEAVIHAENIGTEERAKFTKPIKTLEEIISLLKGETPGRRVLLKKRDTPDDNVVVEYRKKPH